MNPAELRNGFVRVYDYSPLDGAISSSQLAKPMDIDAVIVNGVIQPGPGVLTKHVSRRILFIENKQYNEDFSLGSRITIDDLAASERATAVRVIHTGNLTPIGAFLFDPVMIQEWGVDEFPRLCRIEEFRKFLNDWWNKG